MSRRILAVFALVISIMLVTLLRVSKLHAIDQYFLEREIQLNVQYPLPGTFLTWSITDVKVYEWDELPSEDWKALIHSAGKTSALFKEEGEAITGKAKDAYIAIISVRIISTRNKEIAEPGKYVCPENFLKIGDRRDAKSFLDPIMPIAFWEKDECSGQEISVTPKAGKTIIFCYLLGEKKTVENSILFTNTIVSQNASVGLPLKKYLLNENGG